MTREEKTLGRDRVNGIREREEKMELLLSNYMRPFWMYNELVKYSYWIKTLAFFIWRNTYLNKALDGTQLCKSSQCKSKELFRIPYRLQLSAFVIIKSNFERKVDIVFPEKKHGQARFKSGSLWQCRWSKTNLCHSTTLPPLGYIFVYVGY